MADEMKNIVFGIKVLQVHIVGIGEKNR